jgi:hypothetical protein
MKGRYQFIVILGLAIGLVAVFLLLRQPEETDLPVLPSSSLLAPSVIPHPIFASPVEVTMNTPFYSPLPALPTATSLVTTATVEAIRATRPTATPPAATQADLPYISPETWRTWALRILAIAGVFAYIGLRLRRGQ